MARFLHSDKWIGPIFTVFALLTIFVWVPLDTETGLVETVRRKWVVGDALAPTVAAVFLLIGGVLTMIRPGRSRAQTTFATDNMRWVMMLLGLFILSLMMMRFAGPLLAGVLTDQGYRPLRATIPWKYIGYLLGGTILVGGITSFVVKKIRWRDWVIAFLAALIIALAYDLPFDDLLLPPNGDV